VRGQFLDAGQGHAETNLPRLTRAKWDDQAGWLRVMSRHLGLVWIAPTDFPPELSLRWARLTQGCSDRCVEKEGVIPDDDPVFWPIWRDTRSARPTIVLSGWAASLVQMPAFRWTPARAPTTAGPAFSGPKPIIKSRSRSGLFLWGRPRR
jgi:hypothetical protein